MEILRDNNYGIEASCGGCCACATCHVHVEAEWLDKLSPMEELEDAMLNLAEGRDTSSRLACQIQATPELDGIRVRTPMGQH